MDQSLRPDAFIAKLKSRHQLLHSFAIVGLDKDKVIEQSTGLTADSHSVTVEAESQPQVLDHYPGSIFDKQKQQVLVEDYLYLQQIQSVCFMNELSDNNKLFIKCVKGPIKDTDVHANKPGNGEPYSMLNYVITDGIGNKKYLTALIYNEVYIKKTCKKDERGKAVCPKGMILVSLFPMFQFQEQVLQFIYNKLILPKIAQVILNEETPV